MSEDFITSRHTHALTYSLWERIYFKVCRRWPDSVVNRRLRADDLDQAELKAHSGRSAPPVPEIEARYRP